MTETDPDFIKPDGTLTPPANPRRKTPGDGWTIIHTATLLNEDWEFDNVGWIVESADGTRSALTTNHEVVCTWTRQEAEEKLVETEASAASIRRALKLWPTWGES